MSHKGFNDLYTRLVVDKSIASGETVDLRAAVTLCAELGCDEVRKALDDLRQHILDVKEEIEEKQDLIWAVCKDSSGNKTLRQEINMAYEVYKRELQNG